MNTLNDIIDNLFYYHILSKSKTDLDHNKVWMPSKESIFKCCGECRFMNILSNRLYNDVKSLPVYMKYRDRFTESDFAPLQSKSLFYTFKPTKSLKMYDFITNGIKQIKSNVEVTSIDNELIDHAMEDVYKFIAYQWVYSYLDVTKENYERATNQIYMSDTTIYKIDQELAVDITYLSKEMIEACPNVSKMITFVTDATFIGTEGHTDYDIIFDPNAVIRIYDVTLDP